MTGMRMCGTGAALLTAVLLVVCASGAQGLSATGCAAVAPALRPARVKAAEAGGLPSAGLALWRCSQQLYLRGAGDDDEEEAAEEGGEEGGAEEDGEGDGEKEDKDEGAMTITNSIKQVNAALFAAAADALCRCCRCCCHWLPTSTQRLVFLLRVFIESAICQ